MSVRPYHRRGALFSALLLAFAGCATAPPAPPAAKGTLTVEEATALLQRWEARWQGFAGLRAVVDLTMSRKGRSDRAAGVLLLSPTQLRLEVVMPFGFPALVATAGPDRVTVFRPLERTAWTARPTPEAVGRWLGMPLPPETLIGLLVGRVPPPADPTTVRVDGRNGPHLAFERGTVRYHVWVTPEGEPGRLELEGGQRVTVSFEWALSGDLQSLRAEAPGQTAVLQLRYISAEYVAPPPDGFELALPADVRIERVD